MKEILEKNDKNKLLVVGGFILLIFAIIFGGALIYNKLYFSISYEDVEITMKNAAIEYLNENEEKLPQNINDSITITDNTLVSSEKMKSISELIKDENTTCDGKVIVTNINGKYRYNPILDCDEEYKTIKFIDYINENVPVTESGNGLYNLNNELVYRGENVNNYIKFSNNTYRIVKFKNNYTAIILTEKLESKAWDNRYNIEKKGNVGINDYSISRIKEYLDNLYKGNTLISDENKLLVASHNLPIGKRTGKDTDKSGALENTTVIENQYIGLLPTYDFLNASTDTNCTTTTSESCANYNYLAKYNFTWWTSTASAANSYLVFKIGDSISSSNANTKAYVRPVIYLTNDIIYVSGNGTKENPYIIK